MNGRGISLVISAPSGAGKSTLCKRLVAEFPRLAFSVSCATRSMRQGEVDGVDYFFISKKRFLEMTQDNAFAEWAEVYGNYYGTPLKGAQERLEHGLDVLFDVDVQGALQIKNRIPNSSFVFIIPPSMSELEKRLKLRGQDDHESVNRRLRAARAEILQSVWYDSIIMNDNLDEAYANLRAVYLAARCTAGRFSASIDALLAENREEE